MAQELSPVLSGDLEGGMVWVGVRLRREGYIYTCSLLLA